MKAALVTRLLAVPALAGWAVAWDERPRGNTRAIVLTMVSPGVDYTHSGRDGLEQPRVQADLWCNVSADIAPALAALVAEMELAPNTVKDVAGVRFHPAFVEAQPGFAPEYLEGGVTLYREMVEVMFYVETLV